MPEDPDPLGQRIHMGCGAAFGLGLGLFLALYLGGFEWSLSLAIAALVAGLCGVAAGRLGGDFWWSVLEFLRWLPF